LSDLADYLTFNTGTANTITFSATWAVSTSVTMSVLQPPGPGTVITTASATGTSLSMPWTPNAGDKNQVRCLQLSAAAATGIYTMTITVN
jgi:hypothetical protein